MESPTRTTRTVYAPVQWWDSHTIHVLCPFCHEIHTHAFRRHYHSVDRNAHCPSDSQWTSSYQIKYPFSTANNTTAYEIDKYNGRYVAVGAKPPSPNPDGLEKRLRKLSLIKHYPEDTNQWIDSVEEVTIGTEDDTLKHLPEDLEAFDSIDFKRINHVSSRMVSFGDIDCLEDYLESSPDADIFLEGVDENGDSALLLAAREQFSAIVERLLSWGAEVDFQNPQGRSALMEAALWGRHDNVRHLLEYDADKDLRDVEGLRAIDLAKPLDRNDEERNRHSGGSVQIYQGKTYTVTQARRLIVQLLEEADEAEDDFLPEPDFRVEGHVFRRRWTQGSTQGIQLIAPMADFEITSPWKQQHPSNRISWKAIAWLARSQDYPPVAALSGRSHGITTSIVSGHEWTEEVMQLAEIVSHKLEENKAFDQGQPGRFHACHAEKQLIVYFISNHVFLPHEVEDHGPCQDLTSATPPVMLKQAKILVSWRPCEDCVMFIEAVNSFLDLNIEIVDRSGTIP